MSAIRYWVWLTSLRGVRSTALRLVLDHFGGPMEAYYAPRGAYRDVDGLLERERQVLENRDLSEAERILDVCLEKGIQIITRQDAGYPQRLGQIYDAPPVLYVRGRLPFVDELPAVALVGTRSASAYGVKMGMQLGREVTAAGGCVVTGLALGVDAAAARGALLASGGCIGVLGSAIDVDYPYQNRTLIRDVAAVGAVISEFPPGYPTLPENFPRRNRIISGLSLGVCIIEAPERSGALITANLALEQGRDLFAVPGNADNPGCVGSNRLLRECARAVTCGMDILEEYVGLFPGRIAPGRKRAFPGPAQLPAPTPASGDGRPGQAGTSAGEAPPPDFVEERRKSDIDKPPGISYSDGESRLAAFSQDQQKILRALTGGERHVDEIISEAGLPASQVLAELTVLSIRGAVRPCPGKQYALNLE